MARTGPNAHDASERLGAHAFAAGSEVAFSRPDPPLSLVMHEAAHVVQQRGHLSRVRAPERAPLVPRDHRDEREAAQVARGGPARRGPETAPAIALAPKPRLAKGDLCDIDWPSVGGKTFPLLRNGKPIAQLDSTSLVRVDQLNVQVPNNILAVDQAKPGEDVVSYHVTVVRGTGLNLDGNIQVGKLVKSTRTVEEAAKPKAKEKPFVLDLPKATPTLDPALDVSSPSFDFKKMQAQLYAPKPIPGFEGYDPTKLLDPQKPSPTTTLPFPFPMPAGDPDEKGIGQMIDQGLSIEALFPYLTTPEQKLDLTRKYATYADKKGNTKEAELGRALVPQLEQEIEDDKRVAQLEAEAAEAAELQRLAEREELKAKLPIPDVKSFVSPGMKTAMVLGPVAKPIVLWSVKILDIAADFIPYVGQIKMAIEAITGRTLSGQLELAMNDPFMKSLPPDLSDGERLLTAALVLIPAVAKLLRGGVKAGATLLEIARRSGRTTKEVSKLVVEIDKLATKAPDIEKAAKMLGEAEGGGAKAGKGLAAEAKTPTIELDPVSGGTDPMLPGNDNGVLPTEPQVLEATGTDGAASASPTLQVIGEGAGKQGLGSVADPIFASLGGPGPKLTGIPLSKPGFLRALNIAKRGKYIMRPIQATKEYIEASKAYFKALAKAGGTYGKAGTAAHDVLKMAARGADAVSKDMVGELKTTQLLTPEMLEAAFKQAEAYAAALGIKKGNVIIRVMEMQTGNIYEFMRRL